MLSNNGSYDQGLADVELVRSVAAGAPSAMEHLYRRHHACVKAFLQNHHLGSHVVEDLVHDTFFRAWTYAARFREEASVRTWLLGIARNLVLQMWQNRRNDRMLSRYAKGSEVSCGFDCPGCSSSGADIATCRAEMQLRVQAALTRLLPELRRVVRMVIEDGQRVDRTAARLGCSTNALYKRLRKAIRVLRECFKNTDRLPPIVPSRREQLSSAKWN